MFLLIPKEPLIIKKPGFALIEVILAGALFLIITTFAIQALLYSEESLILSGERQRAILYAEEGLEALRNLRDASFSNLTVGGPYGLATSSGGWVISGTSSTDGEFTRQILIGNNGSDRLIATSTVSWSQNNQRSGSLSITTYLNNWLKSVSGIGNWGLATLETGYAFTPTTVGTDVTVAGDYAYVILRSGTPNFFIINVSSTTSPVLTGSLTLTANLSNIIVLGNYAYVTGTGNSSELQIIDITNKTAPILKGTYNAPGNGDAYGIAAAGNYVYFVRALSATTGQDEFYIINVSSSSVPTLAGSLNLEATTQDIRIAGNYAYIISQDNVREFQIINISNPALPVRTAVVDLVGAATATNARTLAINTDGSIAFVGRLDSRIYPINTSSKTAPIIMLAAGWPSVGLAQDMVLFNNDTYLAVANTHIATELRILDVTSSTAPTLLSALDISGITSNFNPAGIDYSATYDRLYLAGARFAASSNRQLIIAKPQ